MLNPYLRAACCAIRGEGDDYNLRLWRSADSP